eukprot:6214590-Pleurochrysis_carterae.AAC.3
MWARASALPSPCEFDAIEDLAALSGMRLGSVELQRSQAWPCSRPRPRSRPPNQLDALNQPLDPLALAIPPPETQSRAHE